MPVHFPERRATEVTDRALAAWRALGNGPRFLWVHYFDPHAPYAPPPEIDLPDEAGDSTDPTVRQRARYDGEVAYTDRELGRLLDHILAEEPDTIVIAVADHGEALGDHGEKTHGIFLYQSTLAVPLILRAPGRLPDDRRVAAPVSLVDVLPTLLALLGLDVPGAVQGADLAPLIAGGPPPDRPVYAESMVARLDYRFAELYALRAGPLKYIDAPGPELYDLGADPAETDNLAPGDARAATLAEELAEHLSSYAPASGHASATVDAEDLARLRSLGYVAGGAPGPADGEPRGRDPKEMREYFRRHDHALAAISEGRIDDGVRELRALLELAPENYLISYQIAAALLAAGDAPSAVGAAAAVTHADPAFAGGHLLLGEALFRVGRIDDAVESHRKAADLLPESGEPDAALGDLLQEFGRFAAAADAYLRAIDREPGRLDLVRRLLHLRISRGATDRALVELTDLARQHPDSVAARLGLAQALLVQDRDDASRAEIEDLLRTHPDYAPAHTLRGLQLEKAGHRPAAMAAFKEALRLDPGDRTARAGVARLSRP